MWDGIFYLSVDRRRSPSMSANAPAPYAASARASVGAPQVTPVCEFSPPPFLCSSCLYKCVVCVIKDMHAYEYVLSVNMYDVCDCVGWHLLPLCGSPSIAVSERERTHALSGEILYPSTSFAASAPFVGASSARREPCPCVSSSFFLPVNLINLMDVFAWAY